MKRIESLFKKKTTGVLSVFLTAGYPQLLDTVPLCQTLEQSGVDMIEIGFPFSDPLADGPVIQQSNARALKNGMNLSRYFSQLERIRERVAIPLIAMGYLNPVLQFGMEAFCRRLADVGLDGAILPDLPYEYFKVHAAPLFTKYSLANILLITPNTSDERAKLVDQRSQGFLYAVSSAAVTGSALSIGEAQRAYFDRLKSLALHSPLMVGFGIHNRESFEKACSAGNGAIIGSAFLRAISDTNDPLCAARGFIKTLL